MSYKYTTIQPCIYPPLSQNYITRPFPSTPPRHPPIKRITLMPTLHKESRLRINSYQAFLLVQKWKSAPPALYQSLGVKAEIEKVCSICPKLLINAGLYGLLLAPRLNEDSYIRNEFGKANLQPLGPMFQYLLIS